MGEIYTQLRAVQLALKAPKSQKNTFGNYNYRSCEDILEAVKPLLQQHNMTLTISDKVNFIGDRYYIEATATVYLGEEVHEVTASAREEETKKGMDAAQITGSASSYARKYALNGLFNIDDTKDSDTDEQAKQTRTAAKTAPAPTEAYASEAQVRFMGDLLEQRGKTDKQAKVDWFTTNIGVSPTKVLKSDVQRVIEMIKQEDVVSV